MSKIVDYKLSKFYIDDEENNPECYLFKADFDTREVTTNCGDSYYDVTVPFDDFIKFAKALEGKDETYNKGKK